MINNTDLLSVNKILNDVYVIDEMHRVNDWLIVGSERCLLFDTGFGFVDFSQLLPELTNKPIIVLNSHIHPDHSSGNNQFETVYCGRLDEPRAHKAYTDTYKLKMFQNFFGMAPNEAAYSGGWNPGCCKKIEVLVDHRVISLGDNDIEVIETPGHTLGSISLLDRKHRLLFSGDMILTWQVWGQLKESASLSVYYDSLLKMSMLKSKYDYLAPGHSEPGKEYLLQNSIVDIYAEGVSQILKGTVKGRPEHTFLGDGLCVQFEVGGMVYDDNHL